MVASLYAYNFDARVREVLDKARLSFVVGRSFTLTPCVIGVHPAYGLCSAPDCGGIHQMRHGIEYGNTIIGGATVGDLPSGERVLRVAMASRDRIAAYEAVIRSSKGWPVLGEFRPITPVYDLRTLFQKG